MRNETKCEQRRDQNARASVHVVFFKLAASSDTIGALESQLFAWESRRMEVKRRKQSLERFLQGKRNQTSFQRNAIKYEEWKYYNKDGWITNKKRYCMKLNHVSKKSWNNPKTKNSLFYENYNILATAKK